jgi:hypothetical protein
LLKMLSRRPHKAIAGARLGEQKARADVRSVDAKRRQGRWQLYLDTISLRAELLERSR